jgi:hypothetical protein
MRFLALLLLGLLRAPAVAAAEPHPTLLPPPAARAEPGALTRAPLDERQPVELLLQGRAWAPLVAQGDASGASSALGGGAGVGFRTSPYFSLGVEGSALRASAAPPHPGTTFEVAAVGRVYLLESGPLDPYLELALGYSLTERASATAPALRHGPSARAGGGIDLVVLSPLRVGVLVAYREVVGWPEASCALGCQPVFHGGVLAGVTVTLPLGEPL